ncbi:MAG: phosphopyruvate hydratase [Acidobacteria bacterium]|nr:phosphopyruvate hydratase [Acidobacteriota bacterium]
MSSRIRSVDAWQILDSRGNPTLEVEIGLESGVVGSFQVPSGASTGRHEAVELRDGAGGRYRGKSVLRAVENVRTEIAAALIGLPADDQALVDRTLIELDGTAQKARLGANATLGASGAVARAAARQTGVPLWRYLAGDRPAALPVPMVNILSGGLHAGRQIEFQDFLAVPHGFFSFAEAIEAIALTHRAMGELLGEQGFELTGVADEGGFGPRLQSNRQALDLLLTAIERAGFEPGEQISVAIDVASSHFHRDGGYDLRSENRWLSEDEMIDLLAEWTGRAPVLSIEDGLAEDAWDGWRKLTDRLGDRCRLIGDDFFVTNPERLERGIEAGAGNAVLVKMNQIGTLTETFRVIDRAREAGFTAVISARSGETEDDFLADLAVASGAGQIKVGSVTRSERLSKYNRLLALEARTARTGEGPGNFEVSRRLMLG